jgi:anaerobic magnesium-protoporphyrin IX monomethyl ester cyclase
LRQVENSKRDEKMKVLLVQPLHSYEGGNRDPTFFPLGLGYLAKALMNNGHKVQIMDIWAHQWSQEEVIKQIKKLDQDVVGISAISTQYSYAKWLIEEMKKRFEGPLIIGNALPTLTPEVVLDYTKADICVIGEGEITLIELLKNLNSLEKVKGIAYRKDGKIQKTPPQEYIKDLDTIDFPAWDLFPMEIYLKYCRIPGTDTRALNIVSGRGCPYHCRFCSKTFTSVRLRSVDNIIAECKKMLSKFEIDGIFFVDELVVINRKRIMELCDKIEPLHIKWNCQGRVNTVNREILTRMRDTGCVSIGYGVESGSPKILKNMKKQITPDQSRKAVLDAIDLGLYPFVQMMYGYLGEDKKTLKETADFFKAIPFVGVIHLSPTTPLPGTELWDYALEKGLIKDVDAYLSGISAGYIPGAERPFVNLTEFSEADFFRHLKETEDAIFKNQVQNHPGSVFKYYIKHPISNVKYYLYKIQQHQKGFAPKETVSKFWGFIKMVLKGPAQDGRGQDSPSED